MRNLIGWLGVFAMAPALFSGPAVAQRVGDPVDARIRPPLEEERRGWLDGGMGWGGMRVDDDRSSDGGSLILDFTVGRWLSDRIAIGARLGGWTLDSFSMYDPREGESLSEAFGLLKVRPLISQPLTVTLGGGRASYTANDPAADALNGDGVGWRAELEWDAWRSRRWSLGAGLVASWGHINSDSDAEADFGYGGGGLVLRARWRW